jgi:hypothetical protein
MLREEFIVRSALCGCQLSEIAAYQACFEVIACYVYSQTSLYLLLHTKLHLVCDMVLFYLVPPSLSNHKSYSVNWCDKTYEHFKKQ